MAQDDERFTFTGHTGDVNAVAFDRAANLLASGGTDGSVLLWKVPPSAGAPLTMSVADACLVRLSETIAGSTVFTLDGDFRIYRRRGRHTIPLLIPPGR